MYKLNRLLIFQDKPSIQEFARETKEGAHTKSQRGPGADIG